MLAGFSQGTWTALGEALARPERYTGVVLVAMSRFEGLGREALAGAADRKLRVAIVAGVRDRVARH